MFRDECLAVTIRDLDATVRIGLLARSERLSGTLFVGRERAAVGYELRARSNPAALTLSCGGTSTVVPLLVQNASYCFGGRRLYFLDRSGTRRALKVHFLENEGFGVASDLGLRHRSQCYGTLKRRALARERVTERLRELVGRSRVLMRYERLQGKLEALSRAERRR